MNEYNIKVNFEKGTIESDIIELVVNDYNSTKLNFEFDKEEGRNVFKLLYPDGTFYVDDIVNNELILEKGILNQNSKHLFEITKYGNDDRLTVFCTQEMYVRLELANTDEITKPDDRVPILDNLINEVNAIKKDVEDGKYNGKDGIDGIDGQDGATPYIGDNGNWYIDEVDTGMPSQGTQGEKGETGGVSIEEVNNLLTDYATTDYVDEIASNSGGDSPIIEAKLQNLTITATKNSYSLSDTDKVIIAEAITKAYANGDGYPLILLRTKGLFSFFVQSVTNITSKPTSWYLEGFSKTLVHSGQVSWGMTFVNAGISILGSWEGDVFACTSCSLSLDRPQYLSKTNTRSYTPTDTYHPATKQYVDNAIANAITTTLEGSY